MIHIHIDVYTRYLSCNIHRYIYIYMNIKYMLARANPKLKPKLVPGGTRRTHKYQRGRGRGVERGGGREKDRDQICSYLCFMQPRPEDTHIYVYICSHLSFSSGLLLCRLFRLLPLCLCFSLGLCEIHTNTNIHMNTNTCYIYL